MDTNTIIYIAVAVVLGLIIGFIIAKSMEKGKASKLISEAELESKSILKQAKSDAEALKKDKILQAKEKFIELKAEHPDYPPIVLNALSQPLNIEGVAVGVIRTSRI